MAHRIAIIGQSNTVMRHGFVNHLRAIEGIEIGHLGRIGASPSILLPFFAGDVFLQGHDYLVIDVAVVDQLFLWGDAIDPGMIAAHVTYGIHRAHRVGCLPVLLLIPHQATVPPRGNMRVPWLHLLYRNIARANGALCIDLIEPLMRLRERSETMFAEAYVDPNHISEDFARRAAGLLADLFDRIADMGLRRRTRLVALPQYGRLRLADVAPQFPAVDHTNSVFTARFLQLTAGDAFTVATGAIERVIGLLVNRSASDGAIEIAGEGRAVKMLGTRSERELAYVAQISPLIGIVRDRDGIVTIRMTAPEEPPSETTWNALEERGRHAEVAELLLEYQPGLFPVEEPVVGAVFDSFLG